MKLTLLLSMVAVAHVCIAQPNTQPAIPTADTGDSVSSVYFKGHEEEFAIFNGRQHLGYALGIDGHGYFLKKEWQKGSVLYDKTWYHNLMLMYDLYMDELIVQHPNGMAVSLIKARVQAFRIDSASFIHIEPGSSAHFKGGYFQQLTNGDLVILARRVKKLEEKINGLQVEQKFLATNAYYVFKDGAIKTIRKQKDVLEYVKDRQPAVQQLKSRGVRFKRDPEQAMLIIAEFHNQNKR